MSEPHTYFDATITDRWDNTETVYAGCLPTWAAKDPAALKPWKKVRRDALLEARTADPQGWRVKFTITSQDEDETPDASTPNAPAEQASTTPQTSTG